MGGLRERSKLRFRARDSLLLLSDPMSTADPPTLFTVVVSGLETRPATTTENHGQPFTVKPLPPLRFDVPNKTTLEGVRKLLLDKGTFEHRWSLTGAG